MTIYSHRFLSAHGATADQSYIVPGGYVAVARCLDTYVHATGEVDLFFHNAQGGTIWWFHWSPSDQKPAQWQGRQVFLAGETITCAISVGSFDQVDLSLSGYLLTA